MNHLIEGRGILVRVILIVTVLRKEKIFSNTLILKLSKMSCKIDMKPIGGLQIGLTSLTLN